MGIFNIIKRHQLKEFSLREIQHNHLNNENVINIVAALEYLEAQRYIRHTDIEGFRSNKRNIYQVTDKIDEKPEKPKAINRFLLIPVVN